MALASNYLSAIKNFEGFTSVAKWDYAQHTNGFGTKARYPGEEISVAEAETRFRSEIAHAASLVDRFAPGLDDGTRAALTSLTYNAGTRWMHAGLGQAVRDGDLEAVREIFVQYTKAGGKTLAGLERRREHEVEWIGASEGTTNRPADDGLTPARTGESEAAAQEATTAGLAFKAWRQPPGTVPMTAAAPESLTADWNAFQSSLKTLQLLLLDLLGNETASNRDPEERA